MKSTKRINPVNKTNVPIALDSPVVEENLPLPFVHYPNHYGMFIGFSEHPNGDLFFCKCSMAAIKNHFHLNELEEKSKWADPYISAPLSSHFFPNRISEKSLNIEDFKSLIRYKDKICHRCNMATPSLRYCHEMYGGNFIQFYGWYIKQTSYRIGIRDMKYIPDSSPPELINLIEEANNLMLIRNNLAQINEPFNREIFLKISDFDKKIAKIKSMVTKHIENVTREEFGFRKIGEANVSETILTKIISKIFSNEIIYTHFRPDWLEGLELDIFLPDRKIGIEYQGQQHFHPIKAWGGILALEKLRERDARKRKFCLEQGIPLFEIDYTEPLEYYYIKKKICG